MNDLRKKEIGEHRQDLSVLRQSCLEQIATAVRLALRSADRSAADCVVQGSASPEVDRSSGSLANPALLWITSETSNMHFKYTFESTFNIEKCKTAICTAAVEMQ